MVAQGSDGSDDKFIYCDYEIDATGEPETVPFDRFIRYVNNHPGTQFFIFADQCSKEDVDGWLANEYVTVHWWKDMTRTPATDPLSVLVESFNPRKPNFGGMLEVSSSISSEDLYSLYTLDDGKMTGQIILARTSRLPDNIGDYYETVFRRDLEKGDIQPYVKSVFHGWAILGYSQEFDEELEPPRRLDSVLIYSDSDLDDAFIDWGEIIGRHIVKF